MYTCTVIKPKLSGQALRPEVLVTQEAETAGFLELIAEDKPRQNARLYVNLPVLPPTTADLKIKMSKHSKFGNTHKLL